MIFLILVILSYTGEDGLILRNLESIQSKWRNVAYGKLREETIVELKDIFCSMNYAWCC
jgi:hypothetical protein